jgi:repressor LexA
MRKYGLSDTRQKIIKYIRDFIDEKGYAPTVRDILKGCSISSTAVVQHHLNVLEKDGLIHRDPEVFRSIQLMDKTNIVHIPLLGTIAAGEPIPVPSDESWNNEPSDFLELTDVATQGKKDVYALKVKGLSMIDALIDDGDVVLMQSANTANDGEMVAVWLKDRQEVTLKKIFHESNKIRLQPANSQMKAMLVDPSTVEIQGKVIGVIRNL